MNLRRHLRWAMARRSEVFRGRPDGGAHTLMIEGEPPHFMPPPDPIDSGRRGPDPVVLAVATASPPHRVNQRELRAFARRMFARVLAAYEHALQVPRARLQTARDVLRDHGNMSSPTLLFVLERLRTTPAIGAPGLAVALGPGFSAEGTVFRW